MSISSIPTSGMYTLQRALWYLVLLWFLVVCVVFVFDQALATTISFWGVVFVLVMTGVRIVYLTDLFRRANRPKYVWLGVALLIVLGLAVLFRLL